MKDYILAFMSKQYLIHPNIAQLLFLLFPESHEERSKSYIYLSHSFTSFIQGANFCLYIFTTGPDWFLAFICMSFASKSIFSWLTTSENAVPFLPYR